jgi:hypothetical protein
MKHRDETGPDASSSLASEKIDSRHMASLQQNGQLGIKVSRFNEV